MFRLTYQKIKTESSLLYTKKHLPSHKQQSGEGQNKENTLSEVL